MPVSYGDGVIVVPSASAGSTLIWPSNIYIKSIEWVSESSAAGNNAIVTTGSGRVFWEAVATGANTREESTVERWCRDGLKVPTLDTGEIHIYYG